MRRCADDSGFYAMLLVGIVLGALVLRDGPFLRPHPIVWRAVLAANIEYFLFLVYLLFQSATDARQLLRHIDDSLGQPLPERKYAEDCSVFNADYSGFSTEFHSVSARPPAASAAAVRRPAARQLLLPPSP